MFRLVVARHWSGMVRFGLARILCSFVPAGSGVVSHGGVRCGVARLGEVRQGKVRHGFFNPRQRANLSDTSKTTNIYCLIHHRSDHFRLAYQKKPCLRKIQGIASAQSD